MNLMENKRNWGKVLCRVTQPQTDIHFMSFLKCMWFFLSFIIFMFLSVCIFVCTWRSSRLKESIRLPETCATDGCELPYGYLKSSQGPLQKPTSTLNHWDVSTVHNWILILAHFNWNAHKARKLAVTTWVAGRIKGQRKKNAQHMDVKKGILGVKCLNEDEPWGVEKEAGRRVTQTKVIWESPIDIHCFASTFKKIENSSNIITYMLKWIMVSSEVKG